MSLNFSAAHSSRITKKSQHKNPQLKRSWSSPFTEFNRRKPPQRSQSKPETPDEECYFGDRLDDIKIIKSLAADSSLRDVPQIMQHIQSHMFDAMPEGGGFNSTRIAEILNYRMSLPPTVTVAHVHALTSSPTVTEREISELMRSKIIRRTVIPGRGTGGSSVGESLVLSRDLERLVRAAEELGQELTEKFLSNLRENSMASSLPSGLFTRSEIMALMRAGFVTSSSQFMNPSNVFFHHDVASSGTATSISSISKAASGSVAAVGGEGAIHEAGGRGGIRRSSSQFEKNSGEDFTQPLDNNQELQLSLPGTGSYLRLLTAARSHLVSLVSKSKYREMPLHRLRERWDGGISGDDSAAKAKKYRGEFVGVLPSRTRKWKQFQGLAFDWVLAECLGAGLVEIFETSSVGWAVRAL